MSALRFISDVDLEKTLSAVVTAYDAQYRRYAEQQRALRAHPGADISPLVPPPRVLVALAGRPGSGKTTIASHLAAKIQERLEKVYGGVSAAATAYDRDTVAPVDQQQQAHVDTSAIPIAAPTSVCLMPMDGYHYYKKELQQMTNPRRALQRRGAEWTFNARKLQRDLEQMRTAHPPATAAPAAATTTGHGIRRSSTLNPAAAAAAAAAITPAYADVLVPSFSHGHGDPVEQSICVPATAGVVLVEGNYLLYNQKRKSEDWAAVFRCFHVRLFLDCEPAVCLRQLIARHMRAWNVSHDAAAKRAGGSDTKNGNLVDTTKCNADVVLHLVPETEAVGKAKQQQQHLQLQASKL